MSGKRSKRTDTHLSDENIVEMEVSEFRTNSPTSAYAEDKQSPFHTSFRSQFYFFTAYSKLKKYTRNSLTWTLIFILIVSILILNELFFAEERIDYSCSNLQL